MPTAAEILSLYLYLYNQYTVPSTPLDDQFIRAKGVSSDEIVRVDRLRKYPTLAASLLT